MSTLIRIAVEKGYIKSIKQKVLEFFPEYTPVAYNNNREEVTLENLLTMTVPYSYED